MILVDTSVWIDHLNLRDAHLAQILEQSEVCVHPMVVGEIALGNVSDRGIVLGLLSDLPVVDSASNSEVTVLIESRRLFGRGLSFIDSHLLASIAISPGTSLWTRDRRLRAAAVELGGAYEHR